ncbi:DUF4124 domain-containing protein [Oxalobacteraceae bacterium]|nr:DUF4124 domain-containing protein [Oxalobacteraceae bacterium]
MNTLSLSIKSAALGAMLVLLANGAQAQTVYKCTVDGKISYSESPCAAGTGTVLAVPDAPAPPAPSAKAELKQLKKEADRLEKERHRKEAYEARDEDRAARDADIRYKKCGQLRQKQKWAEEDARGATLQNSEAARRKARRAAETVALECPR